MKVWFFLLATLAMLVAAPRAAGAGAEVTGFGGTQLTEGERVSPGTSVSLRIHATTAGPVSYGIDGGYSELGDSYRVGFVPPRRPGAATGYYVAAAENRVTWLAASMKMRDASVGGGHPYMLMMAGVSGHATRRLGPETGTEHHTGLMASLGIGFEGDGRFGPALEFRALGTGLRHGAAVGFAAAAGVRFAP